MCSLIFKSLTVWLWLAWFFLIFVWVSSYFLRAPFLRAGGRKHPNSPVHVWSVRDDLSNGMASEGNVGPKLLQLDNFYLVQIWFLKIASNFRGRRHDMLRISPIYLKRNSIQFLFYSFLFFLQLVISMLLKEFGLIFTFLFALAMAEKERERRQATGPKCSDTKSCMSAETCCGTTICCASNQFCCAGYTGCCLNGLRCCGANCCKPGYRCSDGNCVSGGNSIYQLGFR